MLSVTPYHLTEAVPTALFAMFALWAASSNRHWFVRTAVVGSALLVLLLIPAYEVVIQFGCVVLFMLIAVTLWRKRRRRAAHQSAVVESSAKRIPRVSIATLMLFFVVVAVVTSVAARVPLWPLSKWVVLIGTGLIGGAVGIGCVWIVCGRARWWVRLVATPLLFAGFVVAMCILGQVPHVLSDWAKGAIQPFDHYLESTWKSALGWGIPYWSRSIGVGMAIMIFWLLAVRRAGWFNPFGENPADGDDADGVDRGTSVARVAAIALFVLVALFPLAILYRLLFPPAIPTSKLAGPNGWDDLMAAGALIGPEDQQKLIQWWRTTSPLPSQLYKPEAVALMRRGLSSASVNPYSYRKWTTADSQVFSQLYVAADAYAEAASRKGDLEKQLVAYWDLLLLTNEVGRTLDESGSVNTNSYQNESMAIKRFWPIRMRLSQRQCSELLAKLVDYDKHRDTWEDKHARQRIVDAYAGWETRLNVILADWSGRAPYRQEYSDYNPVIQLRLLITDLAVRAYQLKYLKLPENIHGVVPEFLPAVPKDPFGNGPMVYRKVEGGYVVYSVGPDGDDDDGRAVTNSSWDGDFRTDLMFQ
jgi:hypothetical protein